MRYFIILILVGILTNCGTGGFGNTPVSTLPPHSSTTAPGGVERSKADLDINSTEEASGEATALVDDQSQVVTVPAVLLDEDPFLLEHPEGILNNRRELRTRSGLGTGLRRNGVQIAVLTPQTGPNADIGRALVNGAQMALFDVAAEGVSLIPIDTQGTPGGAARATQEALVKGADLIIGPLLSASVEKAHPISRQADIPLISFSNNPAVATSGAYVLGFSPAEQVRTIIDFAIREGFQRFALIAPETPYGTLVADAVQDAVQSYAGPIVTHIRFVDPAATDFSETITEMSDYEGRRLALAEERALFEGKSDEASQAALKRLEQFETLGTPDFDVILVAAISENMLRTVSAQLAFYDVDQPTVRLLGLQLWDEFSSLSTEPSLVGSWFPAPDSELLTQFRQRYQQQYGRPPHRLASLGYDAFALASVIARANKGKAVNTLFDQDVLTNPQGFLGVDGLFRLNTDGIAQRVYAIREVTRTGVRTLQPARKSFAPAVN